jgi:mannose-6-phosphate isomerase-like protein (cupin superfamily)
MSFLPLSLANPVVRSQDTVTGDLGGVIGARFIHDGSTCRGSWSLVEHPIIPRGLAAPMHLHTREDEYSFVLEGTWGFQLGDEVVYAEPGDLVFKPRDVWHTFWNASDDPGRVLEIISPAGFDRFFVEYAQLLEREPDNLEAQGALAQRYGLHADFESVPDLVATHGLVAAEADAVLVEGD